MKLNPAAFNRFLAGIGQRILWQQATACPCVDVHSGAAKQDCPHCLGKGQVYGKAVQTVVGVASQKVVKQWAAFGQYELGDSVMVLSSDSPAYAAGRWDRITMMDGADRFSRTLVRGRPNERILDPVLSLERVYWLDASNAVVEGILPTVGADGRLTWGATGAPPAGKQYSITGQRRPVYYVFDNMPSDRNEHQGALLPKNLVARRADVLGR